jgi:hypothetical protein
LDFARQQLLDTLADTWNLPLAAVIKHGTENTLWHLRLLDGREISLGTTKDLFLQHTVRQRIFEVTHHMIPRYGARDQALWDHHLTWLALVAQTVDTPEMTREGQARFYIRGYLDAHYCDLERQVESTDWEDLAMNNKPFLRDGKVYLSTKTFWPHIRTINPRLSQPDLLDLLRLLQGRRITVALNQRKTSRSYWRIAISDLQEETKDLTTLTPEGPASL